MRSRTLREGSVGLLILLFLVACGGIFLWLRGVRLGQSSYNIVVEFDNANSLKPGATVRYRGIDIGKVKELKPTSNGVDVTIEVEAVDLRIPQNVDINVNQAGLVGESSVDINPQTSLNQDSLAFSAISDDCNSQLIICENDRLPGSSGASFQELISGTVSLTSKLNDPRFFGNLSLAAENAAVAADRVSELSLELKLLSKSVQQEIKGFSATGDSVMAIADATSRQINSTGDQLNQTAAEFSQVANNVNGLVSNLNALVSDVNGIVAENRGTLVTTLDEISNTSQELRILVNNLNPVVSKVNSSLDTVNTEQLVQNLETMTANASAASANFKDLSEGLNNPTNVLLLQQTLDSARATFENAQKITADLDELTGDPRFRQNLLDLVNGLSNLVSHTEQLEKVVLRSEVIETVQLEPQNLQTIPSNSSTSFPQVTSQEVEPPFASLRVKRSK